MNYHTIDDACRSACLAVGIEFKQVPADGDFHRTDITDDPRGRNDGCIRLFPDCKGGTAWNHKTGERKTFFLNGGGTKLKPEERQRIEAEQCKRKAKEATKHERAALRARVLWQSAQPAPDDHPYLVRKQIQPHSVRLCRWERTITGGAGQRQSIAIDNALLLPLYGANGLIQSVQAIFPNEHPVLGRDRDFLPGGGLAGLFWWIGPRTADVIVCEGFATAASLYQDTGWRTYIAFTANNLLAVGRIVREKLPNVGIVFAADNDANTRGNPGLTKAKEAAKAVGGGVAVPPIPGDFNDYSIFLRGVGNGQ